MSKKRICYLCGGKLSNGRCMLCGLNNKKIERRHYHLNERSARVIGISEDSEREWGKRACEESKHPQEKNPYQQNAPKISKEAAKPARKSVVTNPTHFGKEERKSSSDRVGKGKAAPKDKAVGSGRNVVKDKSVGKGRDIGKWIALAVAVLTLVIRFVGPMVSELVEMNLAKKNEEVWNLGGTTEAVPEEDVYAYVKRELSEDGASYETVLLPGIYKVGVHLPEGTYTVSLESGEGAAEVDDWDNSIYLRESFGEDKEYYTYAQGETWEDVRLYEGAEVHVSSSAELLFQSENAQVEQMASFENPLTESVRIQKDKTLTAGKDFPEGVYDVEIINGYASVHYTISHTVDDENAWDSEEYIWVAEGSAESRFKNVVLPEGTPITSEYGDVILIPSETIESTDYDSYYQFY